MGFFSILSFYLYTLTITFKFIEVFLLHYIDYNNLSTTITIYLYGTFKNYQYVNTSLNQIKKYFKICNLKTNCPLLLDLKLVLIKIVGSLQIG
jgi:hypothetical protein